MFFLCVPLLSSTTNVTWKVTLTHHSARSYREPTKGLLLFVLPLCCITRIMWIQLEFTVFNLVLWETWIAACLDNVGSLYIPAYVYCKYKLKPHRVSCGWTRTSFICIANVRLGYNPVFCLPLFIVTPVIYLIYPVIFTTSRIPVFA